MNTKLTIVPTADGSNTIFNDVVGENYHSRNGALQESQHVFLNAGLHYFIEQNKVNEVSILEVGFGTGLNFLLSADWCTNNQIKLDYCGIEAYPLLQNIIVKTDYDRYVAADIWGQFIAKYEKSLKSTIQINDYCQLEIADCPLLNFESIKQFDVIYFDAFAAAHQPEMWNEETIKHTVQFLKPGGVFVTYAITGNLKRMLKALGLSIQKIPGAAGKREMLRAIR